MYIRIKTRPDSSKRSVQIVQSVRNGNKVCQKVVRHVGTALTDKELGRLKDLAEFMKAEMEAEIQPALWSPEDMARTAIEARKASLDDGKPLPVDLKKLREEKRITVGIHEVYGKVYDSLSLNRVFPNPPREVANTRILKDIVLARIANPSSKRATAQMLERDFGIEIPLEKIYRMMDHWDESADKRLQDFAYMSANRLLGPKINVLFYDCTTLYFESFQEDELKQNGYSKDLKFNQPQVILALLATEEGLPVGYEVFPGAYFEGHTLLPILEKLRTRYEIQNIVFVADSGMLNESNLSLLEQSGFHYIVGARLKNLPHSIQASILDRDTYQTLPSGISWTQVSLNDQRRLIVDYRANRAAKDRYDREKAVNSLLKKLQKNKKDPKSFLNNYGYKKFLTITGTTELSLDEDKITKAARWDGLHGIITNHTQAEAESLLNQYRRLWQIEECFRISKHDLKIRPIYHWTPKRIRAHIAIAFMSLMCVRHLTYRIGLQYEPLSPEVIRNELVHVQLSFLKDPWTQNIYCVPSKITPTAKGIYAALGMHYSTITFQLEKPIPL